MCSSHYTKRMAPPAWLTVVVVLLWVGSIGRAQSGPGPSGVVADPFGAVIPEAVITLYSPDRILKIMSDQEGRFAFTDAPSGKYQLEVSRAGFKTKTIEFFQTGNSEAKPLSIALGVANGGDCGGWQRAISYENKISLILSFD